MCTGVPARVLHVAGLEASVDTGNGMARKAVVAAPEALHRGDYVLLYANLIVSRIDRRSALESLRMMKEMAVSTAREDGLSLTEVSRPFDVRLRGLTGSLRK
jgi:hydrogenase expression/formation protein HypC